MKTLLHVALLYHVENATAQTAAETLRYVFRPDRGLGRPAG